MGSNIKSELTLNDWLIRLRWIYLAIFFALLLIPRLLSYNYSQFANLGNEIGGDPLWLLFFVAIILNLIFLLTSDYLLARTDNIFSNVPAMVLGGFQVVCDLLIIGALIFLAQFGPELYPVLLFIPIVESIVLFNLIGPILVAIASVVIVNALSLNILQLSDMGEIWRWQNLFHSSVIISVIYLVVGFFAAYVSSALRYKHEQNNEASAVPAASLTNSNEEKLSQEIKLRDRQMGAKELELSLAYNRLQKLDEAKSKFVSVTTHEMRTPLAGIKWTFEMMLNGQLGEISADQKEFLEKGFTSTSKLIKIVNDLLKIDAIESDKSELKIVKSDLTKLVGDVMAEFSNQAKSHNVNLRLEKPTSVLPAVELDPEQISIVLENLIDNAIKYSKNSEVLVTLDDSKVNTASGMVEVAVIDQGMGISPEDQSRIFEKFFRSKTAVTTEPDGSGLGLFITKDIIGRHGGSIWFVNRQPGTEFRFSLPIFQKKV